MKKKTEYAKYADARAKRSPIIKDTLRAYISGGIICSIAQSFTELYSYLKIEDDIVKILVPTTLIFLAALLTGLGIFDNIAKFSGAGTLVPITGFANAVASQSLDSKSEGFVLGVGAKMFTIAGPVIVYGTAASVVYGVIYWICNLM